MTQHRHPALIELDRRILAEAKRVEAEIAAERKRRRSPDLNAWRTRRAMYLEDKGAPVEADLS